MLMLIVYALVAVGISFICSVLEAVLLSIPPSYVAMQQSEKGQLAKRLLAFKKDIDEPLAAILTLNTFAHTIGAAGVGAAAAEIWGSNALGIVSAVMTVLILIASEIIPKTIGAVYWKSLVPLTVLTLRVLIIILWPLVKLCAFITGLLRPEETGPILRRHDFLQLTDAGHHFGVLKRDERIIISNLLRFDALSVKDIMTKRADVISLPDTTKVSAIVPKTSTWWTSRVPLFNENLDDAAAYAFKEDVLAARIEGRLDMELKQLQRPLISVQGEDSLQHCYEALASHKAHIALVREASGDKNVVGVVTMEDIVETMFGMEIDDEDEPNLPDEERSEEEQQLLRRSGSDVKAVQSDEKPSED